MDAESTYMILRQTTESATMQDATAFLAICQERGLSPFVEASPIISDYTRRDGKKVHSLAVKEHYAVQERWAQQCGGYIVYKREVERDKGGDLIARVSVISNRDYAAVGKLAAMVPGIDFKEELARFVVIGEAVVTASESSRKAPATKTWEWVAEKRAREAALRQKFGKEPSQARQLYSQALAALTQSDIREGLTAMYPQRQALAVAADPVDAPVIEVITEDPTDYETANAQEAAEAMYPEAMGAQPAPEQPDLWDREAQTFVADTVKVLATKNNKPYIVFSSSDGNLGAAWWKGRDAMLEAAPWIGQTYTKEHFGTVGVELPLVIRVHYEANGQYLNATGFERVSEDGAA